MSEKSALEELREDVSARARAYLDRARELIDFPGDAESLGEFLDPARRLLSGGKRTRAALLAAGYACATAEDREPAISAGAAIELYQTSALIHDDILDAASTRRSQPSAHVALARLHLSSGWSGDRAHFGASSAILLGDFLLSLSTEAFADACAQVGSRTSRAALRAFARMTTEVAFGQYLDIRAENAPPAADAVGAALSVVAHKSARYSVVFPLRIGALLAGASGDVLDLLERVGGPLGEAFQLRDDDLGVFGNEEATGKPVCGDIAQGKRTVLLALMLERLDDADRRRLVGLLGRRIEPDDARWIQEAGIASGARSAHEDMIRRRESAALAALDALRDSGLALAGGLAMAKSLVFELIGRVS